MSEIINLRRRRKAKARAEAQTQAKHNRATFGMSKSQRESIEKKKAAAVRFIDGHKRETSPPGLIGSARDDEKSN